MFHPVYQIPGPGAQQLQRGIRHEPDGGDAALEHAEEYLLEFVGHQYQTLDGQLEIVQAVPSLPQKHVVSLYLLEQDNVQRCLLRAYQLHRRLVIDVVRYF